MTATLNAVAPATVDVGELRAELAANPDTLLLDVRTPGEYQTASIANAVNLPLDQVTAHLRQIADTASGRMVLVCQSGVRATQAARSLAGAGVPDVAVLDGGMNAWVTAGAPVEKSATTRWALERQVRLVAGGIVASSILASVWKPRLRFVAGGIGSGLVFAAVSNTCMMGNALMKLPYNRRPEADVEQAIGCLRG